MQMENWSMADSSEMFQVRHPRWPLTPTRRGSSTTHLWKGPRVWWYLKKFIWLFASCFFYIELCRYPTIYIMYFDIYIYIYINDWSNIMIHHVRITRKSHRGPPSKFRPWPVPPRSNDIEVNRWPGSWAQLILKVNLGCPRKLWLHGKRQFSPSPGMPRMLCSLHFWSLVRTGDRFSTWFSFAKMTSNTPIGLDLSKWIGAENIYI